MPVPSGSTGSLLECANLLAGAKLIPVPRAIGKLLAAPFALLPFAPLLTGDQVEMLQADNIVSAEANKDKRNLSAFGVSPTPMDAILPSYLWRFRRNGQFDRQPA